MAPPVTEEETHFLRLVALIIGVAPRAVRYYFYRIFPPNNLQTLLQSHQKVIDNLRYRKRVLTSVQYNALFPLGSAVTSKTFDITLMICLLRNISGIAPPVTGYDTLPSTTDISEGADLARIKYYRNKIAHSTDSKALTKEFEDAWNDATTAIGRLGGTVFQQECIFLKSSNLDSESYKDILLNIRHSQDEVADALANMVEALKIKTSDLENLLKDTVPQHIRAICNNEITNWKKDDCEFVTTNQLKTIFVLLETKGSLTITGNSGIGKSFTTRHVALQLHSNGYEILPVRKPVDILNYVSKNAKMVFVFDDVCGKTHLLHNEIEDWERYSDEIANCISGKDIKILCNCRLQIFQSKAFESLYLLRKCQFILRSSDFTIPEKRSIASKYISETVLKELSDECIQVHDCFPLLCRMANTWEASKALTFLLNPFGVFENELDKMRSKEKLNFCGLLLVTIFNNSLNDELLIDDMGIDDRNTFDNILEECGETRGTSRKLIKDHLDTMIGVYLIFEDNSYRFANERLFEMTFTFMAKRYLKCMIKHCTVTMLSDKFGLECLDESRHHYQIFVPVHFENCFFERLLKETNNNNFLDIFDCKQMNDRNYRTKFLAFCKNFDSKEIHRLLKLSYFGIDLFHHVCKRGYIYFSLFCLERGADMNKYDDIGMTPLHTACKYENEKLVNVLLNAGASVNSFESRGFSALFGACLSGNVNVVKRLLENNANPNLCSGRRLIPLLVVSEKGYLEIAKLLIEFGSEINQQDNKGFTALHQACRSGHEKIVELLLENGANVNKCSSDGETPLHITCSTSFNNIINTLVAKRADLLALSGKTGLSPLNLLQRDKKEVLISLTKRVISIDEIYSMIAYACEENDKDLLEILMESEIDINRFIKSGKTALHLACLNGNLEIANVLLENQAIVNICTTQGETVMQLCCLSLNCELVKYLITKGADIIDSKESIILPLPLHLACLLNNYEMCSIFLQNDIYIDVNKKAELTLHTAYALRYTKYIDNLLKKVGRWNNICVSPLEIACYEQNIDIIDLLLSSGADPNSCFATGSIPLAVACIFGNENMVKLLLNQHSNVNTVTNIGDICITLCKSDEAVDIIEMVAYKGFYTPEFAISALHIASICNNRNIVKMLLDSKARIHLKCSVNPVMLNILANNCKSSEIGISKYSNCSIIYDVLPLHIACLMGNDNIVEMLLQSNITNLPDYIDSPILLSTEQVIYIHGLLVDFDLVSGEKQTFMLSPIQIACFNTHWTILKTLLKCGASIFETCRISNTILAGFSRNIKELQNREIDGTVYKTSVEMFLFENNNISIIRDLKQLGICFEPKNIHKLFETFVNSCILGDIQTVRDLLFIIPETSIIHQNKAPIHYACEANQAEVVELLVSNNARVNCRAMDFETPIHIATKNECTHIIEFLIRKGGDPLLINTDGDNSFHIACKTNNMECLHLLLQSDESAFIGGHIQEYLDIKSSSGMTPLSIAYDNRNKEMLKVLILKGADVDKRYGQQKESLLFKACKDREQDILLLLLENTASTNVYNIDCKTPLYISCWLGYDEITCILLDENANVNISSYEGYSPLYFSCLHNNVAVAEMLLKKDANPNIIPENSESLLIMSCKHTHAEIIDLLLKYNADVNYCHYIGETALYFAFQVGNTDIMRRLLNYQADWKVCRHERDFHLHLACVRGQYDLINIILEHNVEMEINRVVFNDETLLHTSLTNCHLEIGKLFLQRGADINANSSSFHQICLNGQLSDVVDILNITTVDQILIENEFVWACKESNISLARLLINSCFQDTPMEISVLYEGWFLAAEWSTSKCLHFLHKLGLNVNTKRSNDGHAAIHIACNAGNVDVVRYLLNCENINTESKATFDKLTPLLMAITNGDDKIARLLIVNNANVNAVTASGKNALLLACSYSHENVLSVLFELKTFDILKQFGEINHYILNNFYMPMRSVLREILCNFQVGYAVNAVDSVLHFACRMEDEELLDKLITTTANIDIINAFGETPLLITISKQNVNIFHKLLDANASINLSSNVNEHGVQNLLGNNSIKRMQHVVPLHLACMLNNDEIVSALLNRNADCNLRFCIEHFSSKPEFQCQELSPVYLAVLSNNEHMLTMLLDNSFHPVSLQNVSIFSNTLIEKNHFFDGNTKYHSKLNLTPFQVAVILGFSDIVEIFVDYGLTDVNSKFYVTPLLLSSLTGNDSSIIEVLETYNLQEEHCKTEVTPLLYATIMNHCELINILLNNNASVTYAADISLLDIISIQPEITSLILTCRATFSLTSRCRVNSLFVALLQNDKDVLETSLPFLWNFNDSTDITIIHFLCFRGYSDHLKIILNSNINANNSFSIQCSHLISVSQLTDDIDDLKEWVLPWNRYQFALNISFYEFGCLFSDPYVLQSFLGHPIIMQTSVNVTPCLLTLCIGEQKPPCLFLKRQRLKSTFPICLLAWLLYKTCDAERCHHLPDFVVADLSNLCTIEDSDLIVYTIDFGIDDTDDISENLEHLGLCTSVNFSILLAACINQKWDTVLQMMNFTSLSSNYIHFGIVDLICLRNFDIRDFSCWIPSQGIMISTLELEFLICGNISDILFHITEAKEHSVFFTSAIAACLHNNKRNLKYLLDRNVDMNTTYSIPLLHLMCFMDMCIMKIIELMQYEKMMKINLNAKFKTVHIACLKGLKSSVLRSLMMKCNVNSFATLSPLHIILLTWNTQYLEECAIHENFSKMGQMAPVHILCFRQNKDGIKGLSHTQCDFNSIATNLTFLHLRFLTSYDIFVHKSEKHNSSLSELTPLHIASLIDDTEITKLILRKTDKTDIFCKIFPLHMTFKYNDIIAQLINSYTSFKLTAFHIACIQENLEIGELLIRRNADLSLPAKLSIEFEISELVIISTHSEIFPLHLACLMQNILFTRMISSQVQTINNICSMSVWHICLFLNESRYVEKLCSFSEYRDSVCMLSPLHLACVCGDVSILTLLLRRGADSRTFAKLSSTYAIIYENNDAIVKLFFSYHYKVLKFPLHICAENGNTEQCRVLLEFGADTNVETSFACLKPWHLALYHGHKEILSLLLDKPTEINKKKFLIIFFMYLFRKKYNKQSGNTRIKVNRLVVLSLYQKCLPALKDIVFMKETHNFQDSYDLYFNDAMSTKLF